MDGEKILSLIKSKDEKNIDLGMLFFEERLKQIHTYFEEKNKISAAPVTVFKVGHDWDWDYVACNDVKCIRVTKSLIKSKNIGEKVTFETDRDSLQDSTVQRCFNCDIPVVSELMEYDGELEHFITTEFEDGFFEDYEIYELDLLSSCLVNSRLKPEEITICECTFVCKFYDIISNLTNTHND